MNINGLILAAGNSSRLGQEKQLINYHGMSLVRHIEHMLLPLVDQLYAVVGYNNQVIAAELQSAHCIVNNQWQTGMASSLAAGVQAAKDQADAILIALCDQPRIPLSHYQHMVATAVNNPDHIIATAYQDICGAPAVFPKAFFTALSNPDGQRGAQHLIQQNQHQVITLRCEAAAFDIDESRDLGNLK